MAIPERSTNHNWGYPLKFLRLDSIMPDPDQPRSLEYWQDDDQAERLSQLAESIRTYGVLQPIIVRPPDGHETYYTIVYGERRWRAAHEAGLEYIPTITRTDLEDDTDRLAVQILENLQRDELSLPDMITGLERLAKTRTHEQIGQALGRSREWVTRRVSLFNLCHINADAWQLVVDGLVRDVQAIHHLMTLDKIEPDRAAHVIQLIRAQKPGMNTRAALKNEVDFVRERVYKKDDDTPSQEPNDDATQGGYDGPLEDTSGDPAPVTGHEGSQKPERDEPPTESTAESETPTHYIPSNFDPRTESHNLAIRTNRHVHVTTNAGGIGVIVSGLSHTDWQSLAAHLRQWRPPASDSLQDSAETPAPETKHA